MTRLEARVKGLHFSETDKGKILLFRFRFGYCEDFNDALKQFKQRIDAQHRTPFPEAGWLWEVKNTPETRNALGQIFDNFEMAVQEHESQMRMFK